MTPKDWVTVTCSECSNTQSFPQPRAGWVCADCISKPPPKPTTNEVHRDPPRPR